MMETLSYPPDLNGQGLRIGLVQSRFNETICTGLTQACTQELKKLGVVCEDILFITVPGALEIPFALQRLAQSGQFDALIALGAVIRGQTYHFELVSNESSAGIRQITMHYDLPIVHAILTTDTEQQAQARIIEKGKNAARVAVEMSNLSTLLDSLTQQQDEE